MLVKGKENAGRDTPRGGNTYSIMLPSRKPKADSQNDTQGAWDEERMVKDEFTDTGLYRCHPSAPPQPESGRSAE
nr:Uncharacterised protein [Salmonella sp. NCTC 7297]